MNRILIWINDISVLGGAERVSLNLFNLLKTKYKDIKLLSTVLTKSDEQFKSVDILFNKDEKISSHLFLSRIKNYLIDNSIDIVIVEILDLKSALLMEKIIKKLNKKVFFVFHNTPYLYLKDFSSFIDCVKFPKLFLKKIYKNALRGPVNYFRIKKILSYGNLITVGKNCETELRKLYPKNQNISTIYNPINLDKGIIKDKKNKQIVFLGRFTLQKDLFLLLKSWKYANKLIPDYTLNIVGDGEQKHRLKEFIEKNSISNVYIHNPTSDVISLYQKSDLCILTSHFEGLPTVFLEALSQNCPIFAVKGYGGMSELIENEKNGFYVNSRAPQEIAIALRNFVCSLKFPINIQLPECISDSFILNEWKQKIEL